MGDAARSLDQQTREELQKICKASRGKYEDTPKCSGTDASLWAFVAKHNLPEQIVPPVAMATRKELQKICKANRSNYSDAQSAAQKPLLIGSGKPKMGAPTPKKGAKKSRGPARDALDIPERRETMCGSQRTD